ncbi:MAG TPA: hypothetical protein VJ935_05965 [Acidimicrobiia bacterium]|nr:hypothetical protein [Acidimicrobiia bacterium]
MLRKLKWVLILGIVLAVATSATVMATPGSMITTNIISLGQFEEIDVKSNDALPHQVRVKTKGSSDVYVVSNTFAPGGHSGWHTHAGPSLITVQSGTITAYDGDDPSCTAQVYEAGTGFIDSGDGHVHLLRNEGTVNAVTIAVQILPAGADRRIDAPNPGNCGF